MICEWVETCIVCFCYPGSRLGMCMCGIGIVLIDVHVRCRHCIAKYLFRQKYPPLCTYLLEYLNGYFEAFILLCLQVGPLMNTIFLAAVHVCALYPAAPGSSPKHTIYVFIIYSQICAVFVIAL